jgi:hypothetical protein
MTRKTLVTFGMVVALLVSLFGTVAAQTGATATPTPEPTSGSDGTGSKFFTHPVVQILSAYFGRNLGDTTEPGTPTATPDPNEPTATPDPNNPTPTADPNNPTPTPTATVDPQQQLADEIAAYHEQGIGFGVLVKLYAMAEASQEACPTGDTTTDGSTNSEDPACTSVTVADLLTEFQSGKGMGQLFKEYGKPALLGVGHVKKALKGMKPTAEPTTIGTSEPTTEPPVSTMDQKGNKPPKDNKKGKGNH